MENTKELTKEDEKVLIDVLKNIGMITQAIGDCAKESDNDWYLGLTWTVSNDTTHKLKKLLSEKEIEIGQVRV